MHLGRVRKNFRNCTCPRVHSVFRIVIFTRLPSSTPLEQSWVILVFRRRNVFKASRVEKFRAISRLRNVGPGQNRKRPAWYRRAQSKNCGSGRRSRLACFEFVSSNFMKSTYFLEESEDIVLSHMCAALNLKTSFRLWVSAPSGRGLRLRFSLWVTRPKYDGSLQKREAELRISQNSRRA